MIRQNENLFSRFFKIMTSLLKCEDYDQKLLVVNLIITFR